MELNKKLSIRNFNEFTRLIKHWNPFEEKINYSLINDNEIYYRLGKTDEVADLVYYLSVENTFINGQNIFIDGGYSCLG